MTLNHQELSEREKNILRFIIQQFILTASPVGSRNITKKYDIGVSPATVRNIMSDLEESGFIDHPHTSAGRIPTDKGYRFYVDSLMNIEKLKNNERGQISKKLEAHMNETDELLRFTSNLLSSITHQLACVTYPKLETGTLEKIQIVQLSSKRILVVISIKSGLVKTITLEYETEIKESQILYVQQLLNERLSGLTFTEIRNSITKRFQDIPDEYSPVIRIFLDSVDKIFTDSYQTDKLVISGAKNVIKQPEFEAPEKFQGVIELIEDRDIIIHILEKNESKNDEVLITIGSENENEKLIEYSFVTKEYKVGDVYGKLGIIGPKRMEYGKVVAIVDYVSNLLTNHFTANVK